MRKPAPWPKPVVSHDQHGNTFKTYFGQRSGHLIRICNSEGRSNMISVHFRPIDDSGACYYATYLSRHSVTQRLRAVRREARRLAAGGAQ